MKTWVVVADNRKARVFSAVDNFSSLKEECDFIHPRESGDGNPHSRGGDGLGGSRHGLEPRTLPHEADIKSFAHELAQFLDLSLQEKRYGDLVLVAGPQLLGELRNALDKKVSASIRRSINKDLGQCSPAEVADYLQSA